MKILTNKEFRDFLSIYPDDYYVCVDKTFGWDIPKSENKVDPYLSVNSDIGEIEIGPKECPEMNISTLKYILEISKELGIVKDFNDEDIQNIKKKFHEKYE